MIYTMMPFATDYNLGRAYNESMRLIGDGDWACFLDHDAIWTTREWYRQLEDATRAVPDAGCVTAVQSRGWQKWQVGPYDGHDMARNREIGLARSRENRTLLDVTDCSGIAGVVLLISKKSWLYAGGFVDGMYCVDHAMHFALARIGRRVYVHEGLYVYHWRRANGDAPPTTAPTAPNCPCGTIRRTEVPPTHRISVP